MVESIPQTDLSFNSHVPHQTSVSTRFRLLTKLKRKILYKFYQIRLQGIDKADYSRQELASFFKRHVDHLSRVLTELEADGLLQSEHGGSRNKRRWITWESFQYLDNQQSCKMSDQIPPIPYIDPLLDVKNKDLKILKGEQDCGKVCIEPDINPDIDPSQEIDSFLMSKNVFEPERRKVLTALNASRISYFAKSTLAKVVISKAKNNAIRSPVGYLLASIRNARNKIESALNVFRGKPNLSFYEYAQQ